MECGVWREAAVVARKGSKVGTGSVKEASLDAVNGEKDVERYFFSPRAILLEPNFSSSRAL